ncbi:L-serine ammonia-lyase, iron-sulfur-dependent, subunit alpha [Rubricoccus marinus]|uniref:L-serine ammonia-lyase n=1 Tax=Rubricoccus marinus TaxID=716817 RepID=A0A259U243_9BACT|nr:L-serine ammonia-lyase, iron-sulfur-dependent, subunit alpha [Rubricoccus marinus]OZC04123.1 L-serine ammonia-lyase [Rubricoccus marinus]
MEALSVFDMLKIGVGPSSSHTLGPWRAVQRWLGELDAAGIAPEAVRVHLYGSLALTGRGHCTDQAVCLALLGYDPVTIPVDAIPGLVADLALSKTLPLAGGPIPFDPATDIVFHPSERLPGHANAMRCVALAGGEEHASTYFSIGGGFVLGEGETSGASGPPVRLPYPAQVPAELLAHCRRDGLRIADMVRANERAWNRNRAVRQRLMAIWDVMREGVYRGCHTDGTLPGGLGVTRRAAALTRRLLYASEAGASAAAGDGASAMGTGEAPFATPEADPRPAIAPDSDAFLRTIRERTWRFPEVLKWVSAFALAVNEENANLGRVVTAPTNGAAGVIPAVLLYHVCFSGEEVGEAEIADFLLVAGEVGTFFKKGATISAAMGGCQAEVGVSSAMAAAALCEAQGGTVEQSLMAAEIAMEHHLGMTCDPIGGLVQVPCIERNTMGAVKAINAAELALAGDASGALVSLDEVIVTLRQTAEDMSDKYKETSQGGLAANVSVRVPEC